MLAACAMDPKGQVLADQLMQALLVACAILAFSVGYAFRDYQLMVSLFVAGCVAVAAVTLPDWPWFNRHPIAFRPPTVHKDHGAADR